MARAALRIRIAPRAPARAARDQALALIEGRARSHPEELSATESAGADILSWLATYGGTATRSAVAQNPTTPADADLHLATDSADAVRAALAAKIGARMADPNACPDEEARMATIEIVDQLAHDRATCVRAALSDAMRLSRSAPRPIVRALAHDVDAEVAGPVLEHSPLLSDEDLLQVIVANRSRAVLTPIARRTPLSANIADAIALLLDDSAVLALLANAHAQIREQALDHIAAHAHAVAVWHEALASRTDLSSRAVRQIATFADWELVERLADRPNLDDETRVSLYDELLVRAREANEPVHADAEPAHAEISEARAAGKIDDDYIKAIAETGHRETIVTVLAELAAVPRGVTRRILASAGPGPVAALVRRAGLGKRSAFTIQRLFTDQPALQPVRRPARPPRRLAFISWQFRRAG